MLVGVIGIEGLRERVGERLALCRHLGSYSRNERGRVQ